MPSCLLLAKLPLPLPRIIAGRKRPPALFLTAEILHGTRISDAGSLLRRHRFETMRRRKNQDLHARRRRGNLMPTVQADRLTRIGAALLKAAGASDEEARAVAVGCVNANL